MGVYVVQGATLDYWENWDWIIVEVFTTFPLAEKYIETYERKYNEFSEAKKELRDRSARNYEWLKSEGSSVMMLDKYDKAVTAEEQQLLNEYEGYTEEYEDFNIMTLSPRDSIP